MKRYLKENRILLILLAFAVAVSVAVVAQRWRAESGNTTYDVVLDYTELEHMAEQSGQDTGWWLAQFKDMGITRVALTEENLTTLMESTPLAVTATMMDTVLRDAGWAELYPAAFVDAIEAFGYDRFDVLVETVGREATGFVSDAVRERFHSEDYVLVEQGEDAFLLLNGTVSDTLYSAQIVYNKTNGKSASSHTDIVSSKLMTVSLGLLPEKVELIRSLGLEIIPRTLCYNGHNDAMYARAVLAGYERLGIVPAYIIAGGEAVVGYDDSNDAILDYILKNDITLGLIENNTQRENIMQSGIDAAVEASGYNAVRVFSVWDYIQNRYAYYGYTGAEEIENTLYRAVLERNIRVIYFKPIKQTDDGHVYITDPDIYRQLFENVDRRLAGQGITRGRASVLPSIEVPSLALLVLGLGAGIGGVLLLDTFLPMKRRWMLGLALAAVVCVMGAWLVLPNTYRIVASFASAVVFACLAAAFFLKSVKESAGRLSETAPVTAILPRAAGILAGAVLISLAGAMMTAAPLSSTPFMLEMGIFRGVKLAQLLPLAFFCVLFLSYFGFFERDRRTDTLRVRDVITALRWNIPVWALMVLAAVALVGYYYLARTGHETDVSVSTLEIMFRNELETLLVARPRTKEFLVAFPAVMLAVYCAVRRLPFWTALFGLAGTIGMTSVCNTFMHIRTPLYLGFIRTANSLLFGLALGVLYTLIFELLCRLYGMALKKLTETEQK